MADYYDAIAIGYDELHEAEQLKKIAKMKFGEDSPSAVNQVMGTCKSMGITIGKGQLSKEEQKAAEKSREQKKEEAAAPVVGEAPKEAEAPKGDAPKKGEKAAPKDEKKSAAKEDKKGPKGKKK